MHPSSALNTLSDQYLVGLVDPTTVPMDEEITLSEAEQARQAARELMPLAEDMLLVDDFEYWAHKVLSSTAWAYYRSASDSEACKFSFL